MNFHKLLKARADENRPVHIGLIGAGKFGSMFLAQARHTSGLHIMGIADLSIDRARNALASTGWTKEQTAATSAAKALNNRTTFVTDDAESLIESGGLDVIIEATGDPEAGIRHALASINRGRHIIMVNVEADALAGPLLARHAEKAGIVYSMAYGDQPALICEQVDWARACGFDVIGAGKGTLHQAKFHASTPDTVWDNYGITPERAQESGLNPKMFNSFLDGTKSAIEMAAVANATGLTPAPDGLTFTPCSTKELSQKMIPKNAGGVLHHKGQVDVISSLNSDGTDVENDLRWGTFVTIEAPDDYTQRCFADYGMKTDSSGRYSAIWRPNHLIGLELGISVAQAVLMRQPTGSATDFIADVVAVAKSDLKENDILDGEGGATVWGKLLPAKASLSQRAIPIGLAHNIQINKSIKAGEIITWKDINLNSMSSSSSSFSASLKFRKEMELAFS